MWLRGDGLDAARADPRLQGVLANPSLAAAVAGWPRTGTPPSRSGSQHADGSGPERLAARGGRTPPGGRRRRRLARRGRTPQRVERPAGAAAVADRHRDRCGPTGPELPRRGAAARRVAPAGRASGDRGRAGAAGGGRGAGRVAAAARRQLLPARAGAACTSGTSAGSPGSLPGLYPLTRTRPAHRPRPGRPRGAAGPSCRTASAGCTPASSSAGTRRCRRWRWQTGVARRAVGRRGAGRRRRARWRGGPTQLQRVLRGGLACGISVVLVDIPMTIGAPVETVSRRRSTSDGPVTVAVRRR